MLSEAMDYLGRNPLGVALVAAGFLLLLVPAILRALSPRTKKERAASTIGSLFGIPSRLLSRMHTGDVRMYVIWMIAGAVLLIAVGMLASGISFADVN